MMLFVTIAGFIGGAIFLLSLVRDGVYTPSKAKIIDIKRIDIRSSLILALICGIIGLLIARFFIEPNLHSIVGALIGAIALQFLLQSPAWFSMSIMTKSIVGLFLGAMVANAVLPALWGMLFGINSYLFLVIIKKLNIPITSLVVNEAVNESLRSLCLTSIFFGVIIGKYWLYCTHC